MKITWASNAPWAATGYGQQTAAFVPRFIEAGHDVAIAANYGLQGAPLEWDGIKVYPASSDYSNDVIPAHAMHHFAGDPGLLMFLYDAWPLRSDLYEELNTAVWVPVDHMPAPPLVVKHFKDFGSIPIAMSRFGEQQLQRAGLDPLYVPHGIDTNVYRPHPTREAKIKCGMDPDKFVVGIVANNKGATPSRKAFPEMFTAFRVLNVIAPDAHLYVHSNWKVKDGLDLRALAAARDIPEDAITFADQYRYLAGTTTNEQMSWIYSAFDLLLFTSMGEGFGIPALEAQACGTPVIVTDFSAQSELVAPDAGFKVEGQPWWDELQKSDFQIPMIEQIVEKLRFAYVYRDQLEERLAGPCREFALQYDADRVMADYWVPALAEIEDRLNMSPLSVAPIQ